MSVNVKTTPNSTATVRIGRIIGISTRKMRASVPAPSMAAASRTSLGIAVSPDGSKVQITIHKKIALGRAGAPTYAIDFNQQGGYTIVTTQNRGMTPELAAKMQFDIDRWKRGETNCSKQIPKAVTASAPAPR